MENNGKSPAEEQNAVGFAALSDVNPDSLFDDDGKKDDNKGNDTDGHEDEIIDDIKIPDTDKKDDNAASGSDKNNKGGDDNSDDKKDDKKKDEEQVPELKLPGEENDDDDKGKGGNDDSQASTETWTDLAKELGFEVKEESFAEFKRSYDEYRETQKQELEKEYKSKGKEDLLLAFNPESQFIIKALDAGLSLEQIQKPFEQIDKYLSMSDADLVAEDLRLQGWPEDKIEKKVLDLTETEKLELNAFEIRKALEDSKKEISLSREKEISEIRTQQELKIKETLQKEAEAIHTQLKTVQSFMESPIKEKHIEYVMNKWKNGEYHDAFKDPKKIADFLLYSEFGEQAVKNLANKKLQKGRDGIVNELHNLPPKVTGNQGTSTKSNNTDSPIGNFTIFEGLNEDQV